MVEMLSIIAGHGSCKQFGFVQFDLEAGVVLDSNYPTTLIQEIGAAWLTGSIEDAWKVLASWQRVDSSITGNIFVETVEN